MNISTRFAHLKLHLAASGFREGRWPGWLVFNKPNAGQLRIVLSEDDECFDVLRLDKAGVLEWQINLRIQLPDALLVATLRAALGEVGAVWYEGRKPSRSGFGFGALR